MILSELLTHVNGFVVGGAVRDLALGKKPKDFDVVTPLTPDEVRQRVPVAYAIGEKFGTVCVETSDVGIVEVTTMRREVSGGRKPDVVWTTSLSDDLARRDFTINTLFMEDTFCIRGSEQAIDDLNNGIIRCVGSAHDRLNEDPLRALRAIRFKLQLGFEIAPDLEYELKKFNLQIGTTLAGTRVMDELKKMFTIDVVETIFLLQEYNLLYQIFPEVLTLQLCAENQRWHPNEETTLVHTLNALKRAQTYSFEVQIATLLHDIGKGVVRHGNSTKYYGHARAGKLLIQRISERLLWSNDLREACEFVCENHMKMHVIEEMRPFKRRELYMNDHFNTLYHVHICDIGDRADLNHIQWIIDDMKKLCAMPALITGHDIVKHGIVGKRVGELKELCHEAQLRGDFDSHATGIEYLKGLLESD